MSQTPFSAELTQGPQTKPHVAQTLETEPKRHINHGCLELPRTQGTPAPCLAPTLCGGRSPPSSSGCSPSCQAEPRINFSLFGPNSAGLRDKRHVPQAPEAKMPKEPNSGTLRGVTQGPLQGRAGQDWWPCVCSGRFLPGFLRDLALMIGQS